MEEKLVTLAILTYSKAQILKNVLENENIEVYIHNVNLIQPVISSGVRVRIKESDLPHALRIIESSAWLADEVVKEEPAKPEHKRKEILIPIDFSEYSMRACEFGFHFADEIGAEITLMHVYFSPIYMPSLQYATEGYDIPLGKDMGIKTMLESIHNQLDDLTTRIKDRIGKGEFPDVKYTCILREGVPEEEIVPEALLFSSFVPSTLSSVKLLTLTVPPAMTREFTPEASAASSVTIAPVLAVSVSTVAVPLTVSVLSSAVIAERLASPLMTSAAPSATSILP